MKHGYYPEDPMAAYECDMLCDAYADVLAKIYKPHFVEEEKREAMYAEIFEQVLPKFLTIIAPLCEKNDWLVGDRMTIADFWIAGLYTNFLSNDQIGFAKERFQAVLKAYPAFEEYGKRFFEATVEY